MSEEVSVDGLLIEETPPTLCTNHVNSGVLLCVEIAYLNTSKLLVLEYILVRVNQVSNVGKMLTFQSSSQNSKKKYAVPLLFAWHINVSRNVWRSSRLVSATHVNQTRCAPGGSPLMQSRLHYWRSRHRMISVRRDTNFNIKQISQSLLE